MKNRYGKRVAGIICALAMLFSSLNNSLMPVIASALDEISASSQSGTEEPAEPAVCRQSFELYPNGEEAGQKVTLDGFMPEGAVPEVLDVTDEHEGIAAYDITINDGENEFQPGEENPILVEITVRLSMRTVQLSCGISAMTESASKYKNLTLRAVRSAFTPKVSVSMR